MTWKVLMVNTVERGGGAARAARNLMKALNCTGEASVRLVHSSNREMSGETIGVRRLAARQINAVISRIVGVAASPDFGLARQIADHSSDYDIIHLHNLHGYYVSPLQLLTEVRRRPIVWTWHDMWPATGRCAFSGTCDRWSLGCGHCPSKGSYPAAWLDRSASEFRAKSECYRRLRNTWIVVPSRWLAQIAIDRGFWSRRVQIIPYSVDPAVFSWMPAEEAKKQLGFDPDVPVVVFAAADCNDTRKGYRDFAFIAEEAEESAGVFVAAGKPPRTASPKVRHVGSLGPRRLRVIFAAADCVVIPSTSDNFPFVALEAMASGTPVVGYRVGGLESILELEGNSGAPVHDLQTLARLVRRRVEPKGQKSKKLSRLISETALNTWAPAEVARRHLALYREALAADPQRGRCFER